LCVPYSAANSLPRVTEKLTAVKKPAGAEPCSDTDLGKAACRMMNSYPADYMAPLVVGKAYLEGKNRDLKKAAHWLSRAMYLNPTHALSHRLMGRALYLAGHHEQALGEYRLSARWDPSSLTSTAVEVLRLTGDPQAAIRATPEDAQAYLSVSRILRNLGKKPAAAKAAKLALEQDSALIDAVKILGEMALEDRRWEEVLGYARQARQVDPLNDWAYDLQGMVHYRQKELKEAEKAWQEGLNQVPDSTTLAYRLGEFYLAQGRFPEAEQIAGRLQNFAPSDDASQARLNMLIGRIQEAKGMLFEARRSYRMASTLAPGAPYYLYRVGLMEEKLGKLKDAEMIYQRLVKERYRVKDMQARIAGLRDTSKKEHDQAMWETWVDKKEEKDEP
jgi:tetratricopeptide (TPR) repeat protein